MKSIADFLLPSHCLLCHMALRHTQLCTGCTRAIAALRLGEQCCQRCALPLLTDAPLCGYCLSAPPAFDVSLIPFGYRHPVDYLVQRFKYENCQASGQALGHLLAAYLQNRYAQDTGLSRPDIIIPTPLHWRRCFSRGYNQTAIIARMLSRQLMIPCSEKALQRLRHTEMQKGLERKKRIENVRGAFSITTKNTATVKNKVVAVLDDVVTTTTTVREISRVLRKAGAREIHIWALARTPAK